VATDVAAGRGNRRYLDGYTLPSQLEATDDLGLAVRGADLLVMGVPTHGFRQVLAHIPADQRRLRVDRDDLARFLFGPDDVVLMVGQDGLVPNAAKYLSGQLAIGINPDPSSYDGILCAHSPEAGRCACPAVVPAPSRPPPGPGEPASWRGPHTRWSLRPGVLEVPGL